MRTVLLTLVTVVLLVSAGAFTFIYTGVYDVSATSPHWPVTYWVMDKVRTNSIRRRAANITPPPNLNDHAKVVGGTEHYAAHCASCHGAPGVPRGEIAAGLYPKPADLTDAAKRYTPGELFWTVKNGVKMSGMPAWSDHSDDELWSTVAFIEKLPGMREADYAKLVIESLTEGGARHSGVQDGNPSAFPMKHPPMGEMAPAPAAGHQH